MDNSTFCVTLYPFKDKILCDKSKFIKQMRCYTTGKHNQQDKDFFNYFIDKIQFSFVDGIEIYKHVITIDCDGTRFYLGNPYYNQLLLVLNYSQTRVVLFKETANLNLNYN